MKYLFAVISLFLSVVALAGQEADHLLEPPEIPESVQSGEALEPEVTIREDEEETHYEYRINGRLYMVKIVPNVGPPYYLIDTDGDGSLDAREREIGEFDVPQWVLFSW